MRKDEIPHCERCGYPIDDCQCRCPYCDEIELCRCAIGSDKVTGGG